MNKSKKETLLFAICLFSLYLSLFIGYYYIEYNPLNIPHQKSYSINDYQTKKEFCNEMSNCNQEYGERCMKSLIYEYDLKNNPETLIKFNQTTCTK